METDLLVVQGTGVNHGHTDVSFTYDFVFWGSDVGTGQVLREDRNTGKVKTLMSGDYYNIWWIVADGNQLYVGTMPGRKEGGQRPAVIASQDQGATWQKILESPPSRRPYDRGFAADSRYASINGWVYCSNGENAFRFRIAT